MFSDCFANIYSKDIGRALVFDRDLLGFEPFYRFPAGGEAEHVELRLGGAKLALSSAARRRRRVTASPIRGRRGARAKWANSR